MVFERSLSGMTVMLVCLALPAQALAKALPGAVRQDAPEIERAAGVDSRPYETLRRAGEVFNAFHRLAPEAVLRYRLHSLSGRLELYAHGFAGKLSVPLDKDRGFTLPPGAKQQTVITNRPSGSVQWRVDVRTPGLPADTRRLGDLRLECLIDDISHLNLSDGSGVNCMPKPRVNKHCRDDWKVCANRAAEALSGAVQESVNRMGQLKLEKDLYEKRSYPYLFIADRPVFTIILSEGERRVTLPAAWLYGEQLKPGPSFAWPYPREFFYSVPLSDGEWSDDARVTFEYL
ncbi:hypothetical protein [Paludibacterium paludis]|uniref:Uncharacterized protein n=1 Tax=Paludibacterium paludis TaxID=1225769 RepID=A0A918P547_9NEIS|nr:hypothetical protein [Paludibacterium paludis]GGY21721.1 hypothetical protein GCM10011289_26770 [Paludibacterium paludis]